MPAAPGGAPEPLRPSEPAPYDIEAASTKSDSAPVTEAIPAAVAGDLDGRPVSEADAAAKTARDAEPILPETARNTEPTLTETDPGTWEPREIPRPTYTMKAKAVRSTAPANSGTRARRKGAGTEPTPVPVVLEDEDFAAYGNSFEQARRSAHG